MTTMSVLERNTLCDACVVLHSLCFEQLAQTVALAIAQTESDTRLTKITLDGLYDAAVELYSFGTTTLADAVAHLYIHRIGKDIDQDTRRAIERLYALMVEKSERTNIVEVSGATLDGPCVDCGEPIRYHTN